MFSKLKQLASIRRNKRYYCNHSELKTHVSYQFLMTSIYQGKARMLRYLFVDFNAYFASVEQQRQPQLRGKPIAVVPVDADTTSCIAASYEAKKFGIKTGTLAREAKRLCPDITLVPAHPTAYIEYHHKLVAAVEQCLHIEKVMSIDEMVCELTGSLRSEKASREIADHIKRTISQTVGTELRCSIGIAPNIFLAKTATDMQKPNGCTVINNTDIPQKLYPLVLQDLCGIGSAMHTRLRRASVYTVEELYRCSKKKLHRIWGSIEGERMYERLRGELVSLPATRKQVVGHSHVLPPQLRSHTGAYSVLQRLLQKAMTRLRSYGYTTAMLTTTVKYTNGERWEYTTRFQPSCDTQLLVQILTQQWSNCPESWVRPVAVSLTLSKLLLLESTTLPLFDTLCPLPILNTALDEINSRFGRNTVYFASAHHAIHRKAAPMRIAFTHIPDLETESDAKKLGFPYKSLPKQPTKPSS